MYCSCIRKKKGNEFAFDKLILASTMRFINTQRNSVHVRHDEKGRYIAHTMCRSLLPSASASEAECMAKKMALGEQEIQGMVEQNTPKITDHNVAVLLGSMAQQLQVAECTHHVDSASARSA